MNFARKYFLKVKLENTYFIDLRKSNACELYEFRCSLEIHITSVHERKKSFRCEFCGCISHSALKEQTTSVTEKKFVTFLTTALLASITWIKAF